MVKTNTFVSEKNRSRSILGHYS